jgi:hypothetical protein
MMTNNATTPLVFVDTETTGLSHRRLPWELAVIRRDPGGSRRELHLFIEVDLSDADPCGLDVGRFYDRHPYGRWLASGALHLVDVMRNKPVTNLWPFGTPTGDGYVTQEVAAIMWCRWTHGAHVVGAVPNFDTETMDRAARLAGLTSGHHYHLMDIENLVVGYLAGRGDVRQPPWHASDLFAAVGVTIPDVEQHTALGDARGVERAWDKIMGSDVSDG